jgi:hypothetical protein
MWGLGRHTLPGIIVDLLKYVGSTLYWVLLLVYVGSRATHFTGYCCWVYVGPRATHFTGYCCLVYVGLGQHTLLGIVVGLRGPRATHITGYCCWFMWGLGQHTLLGLMWAFSNGLKIICFDGVEVSLTNLHIPLKSSGGREYSSMIK